MSKLMRVTLTPLMLVALALTASCTASFVAETQRFHQSAIGVSADTGEQNTIKLRGVVAVVETEGLGTLLASIRNSGADDTLLGIEVADGSAQLDPAEIPLTRGTMTRMGVSEPDSPIAVLNGPRLVPGRVVELRFHFQAAAPVELDVQVMRNAGAFADIKVPEPTETEVMEPSPAGG